MIENIRLSFQGLWSHKMRSILTMLGIIIGIAAVMAIVSTIKGTNDQIREQLIGSGKNTVNITLQQGGNNYMTDYGDQANIPAVSEDIREKILSLSEVENITAYRSGSASVFFEQAGLNDMRLYGIDSSYLETCGYTLKSGRGLNQKDYDEYRSVILLDETAATRLFDQKNPLGKIVEISGMPFTVVGVIADLQPTQRMIYTAEDYYNYEDEMNGLGCIPNTSWPLLARFDTPENVILKAVNTNAMKDAGQKAAKLLNSVIPDSNSSTAVKYKAEDILGKAEDLAAMQNTTQIQLLWIAGISLVVGGIGVMNIMLVSVTERTSEIGLKKAIGARKNAILAQFLTEAAVLTSVGGILGVLAGVVVSQVIHRVTQTPVGFDLFFSIVAVVFSMAIGLIFGFFPSVKAANMDPIEALRRE